jgi:hypothetical protein
MARIYVSSTYSDLRECRERVRSALRRLGHEDIAMEYYVAESRRPLEKCLADVSSCDLYIGILAWKYGHVPAGRDKSMTELEFRKALEMQKPCLLFLLDDRADWPADQREVEAYPRIKSLRDEIRENFLTGFFTGKEDLEARVIEAVVHWQHQKKTAQAQAPPLPAHHVERSAVAGPLIEALLTDLSGQNGILVVSALHGLGGVGKTALAAAVSHDPRIREHFRDGILWSTLGQSPDCLSLLTGWLHALGDTEYRPTTVSAASAYLRTLLHPASVLLVLDDVWDPEHARPFLAGGPRCRLLLTTRRAHVADELGAQLCALDVMTPREAVELLAKRVAAGRGGKPLSESELQQAAALAEETGHLPLALELMAALVARGYTWDDARKALRLEQGRRGEAQAYQHRAQAKLDASLRVSLTRLRTEDPAIWECFAWLGVLPDEVVVNAEVTATLWGLPVDDARQRLHFLADEALLQRREAGFAIHDLMHEMARQLLISPQPEGLGMSLIQATSTLLSRYAGQIQGHRWDTLPDDGYIHSRLLWHFRQAGAHEATHDLLRLTTPDGRNAWYMARDGQTAGFMEDVRAAWRLDFEATDPRFGRQCRYAAMISSLHSLTRTISPKILSALLQHGVWNPTKALDYVRQMRNAEQRAEALVEIFERLAKSADPEAESLRSTVLSEVRATIGLVGGGLGAELLARLSYHLSDDERNVVIQDAIACVSDSSWSLRKLAKSVPPAFRDRVLEAACVLCLKNEDPLERAKSLADALPDLSPVPKEKWLRQLQKWIEELPGGEER